MSLNDILGRSARILLFGEGGSGKSTICRYLALALADMALGAPPSRLRLRRSYLPLLIQLRDASPLAGPDDLVRVAVKFQPGSVKFDKVIRNELEAGNCFLIMDGLDEVEELDRTTEEIRELTVRYPQNFFLITSRSRELRLDRFEEFRIVWTRAKLELVARFVARAAGEATSSLGSQRSFAAGRLAQFGDSMPLNPLLATLGALATDSDHEDDVVGAYVARLLSRYEAGAGAGAGALLNRSSLTLVFGHVAREMRDAGMRTIDTEKLVSLVEKGLGVARAEAVRLLPIIGDRPGILVEVSLGRYSFAHDIFLDYFARQSARS